MSLRPCQECGEQVSTQAASCPRCGAPVNPPASSPPASNKILGEMDIVRAIGTVLIVGLFLVGLVKCFG